jgi:hypothetical protein
MYNYEVPSVVSSDVSGTWGSYSGISPPFTVSVVSRGEHVMKGEQICLGRVMQLRMINLAQSLPGRL